MAIVPENTEAQQILKMEAINTCPQLVEESSAKTNLKKKMYVKPLRLHGCVVWFYTD